MSISPEWFGIGITAVGAAIAVGRIWQMVLEQGKSHKACLLRREEMETRIFDELRDLAEGVNKIKGKLDLSGD